MKKIISIAIVAFALLGCLYATDDEELAIEAALQAGEASLELIDEEKYTESWQQAADFIKKMVTEDQWVSGIKGVRTPFGKMKSRKATVKQYNKNLTGMPEGEYVLFQFETVFENKAVVETIVLVLEDGIWRNTTYRVR